MPPPSWTGRDQFFYLRLTYGTGPTVVNFVNPVHIVDPPTQLAVRAENVSLAGFREVLHIRDEVRLHVLFQSLFTSEVESLRTYWDAWGKFGRQSAIILDREDTASGQDEYDNFNTFFTRAELLTNPFEPKRRVPHDAWYVWDAVWRQGEVEAT